MSSFGLAENGAKNLRFLESLADWSRAHDPSRDFVFAEIQTIPMQSMSIVDLFQGSAWA